MTTRALVLGGGGVAGIAWETGVLVGLAEAGIDVRNADLFLGTSAGSSVAAQLTSGITMNEFFQLQVDPRLQAKELPVNIDMQQIMANFTRILRESRNITEILQRVGALSLATPTIAESERLAVIASRLPVYTWPQSRLALVAVDAHSGERIIFERESAVNLVDAVAASCAVPFVWPPVTINGHRYIDGGTHSNANADLAIGFERVLILQPDMPTLVVSLDEQLELLRNKGVQVEVIISDETMKSVLDSVGGNPLDPSVRELAANVGRKQGQSMAARVAALWL